MKATFEQARAQYESDEQMARALFDQVQASAEMVALEQALRRRAETMLQAHFTKIRNPSKRESLE